MVGESSLNEEELIHRSQDGDLTAFELLIERHMTTFARTAYLATRDRESVQDVMQEALIQIWKDLPSYKPHGSFKAWTLKILLNKARKHYRKKRVETVPLEVATELSGDSDGLEEMVERLEQIHDLRRAFDLLSADHREVLILRYYNELTVPEIARTLGRFEGTVKARLSRARKRLGEVLSESETQATRG